MRLLGIDPGLASFGIASAVWEDGVLRFTGGDCYRTKKNPDVPARQDLWERLQLLAAKLPNPKAYDLVLVEGMSHVRDASVASKLSAVHGVLATWCLSGELVAGVSSPQDIRKTVLGASKVPPEAEVHDYLLENYPNLAEIVLSLPKYAQPHILDAGAAIVAFTKEL